jgi:hypothetical protein
VKTLCCQQLGLFRAWHKQLFLDFGVFIDGTQIATKKCVVREQTDMSLYRFGFLRWLLKNAAERHRVPGKEDVMAKLIEFYVPANFKAPKVQLTPEELRGKIIDFHASNTRKSA